MIDQRWYGVNIKRRHLAINVNAGIICVILVVVIVGVVVIDIVDIVVVVVGRHKI